MYISSRHILPVDSSHNWGLQPLALEGRTCLERMAAVLDMLLRWTFTLANVICSRKLQGVLTTGTDRLVLDSHHPQNGYANSICLSAGLIVLPQRAGSPPADHHSKSDFHRLPARHRVSRGTRQGQRLYKTACKSPG